MKTKLLIALMGVATMFIATSIASFPVKRTATTVENSTVVVESSETAKLTPAAAPSSGKSQITALLLSVLVGGLGIHRFYLGYTWQGIVQLLTFGGCGIWSLIDLIRIITGDLKPKGGSYSKTF